MTLWISDAAREAMAEEARTRPRVETGGGLFGYESDATIVIEQIGVARGATKRTATSFIPDHLDLQTQIDRVIAETDGRCYLVGEWHTHPWGVPYLSRTDKASVRRTADRPAIGLARPVAIVLAPTGVPGARARLRAFRWDPLTRVIDKQRPRDFALPVDVTDRRVRADT